MSLLIEPKPAFNYHLMISHEVIEFNLAVSLVLPNEELIVQ